MEALRKEDLSATATATAPEISLLEQSKNKLKKFGLPTDGMTDEMIIAYAKKFCMVEEDLSSEKTNERMKAYRQTALDCKKVKQPLETLASASLEYVESEIGVNPTWSKGGSIKLDNNDRIQFSLKFINPNADDKALKAKQEISKTFVSKLQKTVENVGLKELREYLVWKLQDKESSKQGIFSDVIKVGKYNVQLELGYAKAQEKEEE